jgi:hypothetical protein
MKRVTLDLKAQSEIFRASACIIHGIVEQSHTAGMVPGRGIWRLFRTRNAASGGVKRQELSQLFALNRKLFKAYLRKKVRRRQWPPGFRAASG